MRAAMTTAACTIADLEDERVHVPAIAAMLVDGFREHWPDAWPTLDDAAAEVHAALEAGHIALIALANGDAAGFIGGFCSYDRVWELHPLVVRRDARRRGIGRMLVEALERRVAAAGGLTLMLGTNDDAGMTTLSGIDLYPNPLEHLQTLEDRRGHPFAFYRRLGYAVAGVIPDASGHGKPDILMTKRLQPPPPK